MPHHPGERSLQLAQIRQVYLVGEDLLVAFSNGTSVLLAVEDIRHLALTAAKMVVTEEDAADG